ncbi:hypothetical protein MMC26_001711 [Xylographa opegraphella]|nr:hypothetical protein [Xylographa opegraphella]
MSRSSAYISLPGETRDEGAHLVSPDEGSGFLDTSYNGRNASRPMSMPGRAGEGYSLSTPATETNRHGKGPYTPSIRTLDSEYTNFGKEQLDLSREFSPRKQLLTLLSFGVIRFIVTAVLVGGLYATLWLFEAKSVMNELQKKLFNTIITALSMALGINIASSFKNVAIDTRWFFLSRKNRPLKEVDMILSCNSLTTLIKLALSSTRRPMVMLVCIAAQAAVAMLGLTYSMNPASDPAAPITGGVSVTDMSAYYFGRTNDVLPADQLAAHMYGELSLNFYYDILTLNQPEVSPIDPLTLYSDQNVAYWIAPDYVQHVFLEWPTDSASSSGTFYTNRTILSNSTCAVYKVTQGANGDSQQIYFMKDGTVQVQDFQLIEPNSTTYYTSPELGTCGPRCANVCAFENTGVQGFYYECEISVGSVVNATRPEHEVPDRVAKMAAGAIALQGYQAVNVTDQYQRYPAGYEGGIWMDGDAAGMAAMMRQFAMGTISAADLNNPNLNGSLLDLQPGQGVQLSLDHPANIHAILITVLSVQLLLFVIGALVANRAVVVDDSYIAIARLLRPVVDKLGAGGGLLDGDAICDALGDRKVVYGTTTQQEAARGVVRHLGIGEMRPTRSFPAGYYD